MTRHGSRERGTLTYTHTHTHTHTHRQDGGCGQPDTPRLSGAHPWRCPGFVQVVRRITLWKNCFLGSVGGHTKSCESGKSTDSKYGGIHMTRKHLRICTRTGITCPHTHTHTHTHIRHTTDTMHIKKKIGKTMVENSAIRPRMVSF
jgi:hypothetical protein